jgi:hypothetical protein
MLVQQAPFKTQPHHLATISTNQNSESIGDKVLPRVSVDSPTFKYLKYSLPERFSTLNTVVGHNSGVIAIDWTVSEKIETTDVYALQATIPQYDVMLAQNAFNTYGVSSNPEAGSIKLLSNLIEHDREFRVANIVMDSNSYPVDHITKLTGASQWNNYGAVNGGVDPISNPIADMTRARDGMIAEPNTIVMGRKVATALQSHPFIVKAYYGNACDTGIVPLSFVGDLLGVENVLVGKGRINIAKKGQPAQLVPIWGNHLVMFYQAPMLTLTTDIVTFGFTAVFGNPEVKVERQDPTVGFRGGTRIQVGESVRETIISYHCAHIFPNVVS